MQEEGAGSGAEPAITGALVRDEPSDRIFDPRVSDVEFAWLVEEIDSNRPLIAAGAGEVSERGIDSARDAHIFELHLRRDQPVVRQRVARRIVLRAAKLVQGQLQQRKSHNEGAIQTARQHHTGECTPRI